MTVAETRSIISENKGTKHLNPHNITAVFRKFKRIRSKAQAPLTSLTTAQEQLCLIRFGAGAVIGLNICFNPKVLIKKENKNIVSQFPVEMILKLILRLPFLLRQFPESV